MNILIKYQYAVLIALIQKERMLQWPHIFPAASMVVLLPEDSRLHSVNITSIILATVETNVYCVAKGTVSNFCFCALCCILTRWERVRKH